MVGRAASGYAAGMLALIALLAQAAPGRDESGATGLLIILGVLVLIVLAIGAVWTFAARRGSKVPGRKSHPQDHLGH